MKEATLLLLAMYNVITLGHCNPGVQMDDDVNLLNLLFYYYNQFLLI